MAFPNKRNPLPDHHIPAVIVHFPEVKYAWEAGIYFQLALMLPQFRKGAFQQKRNSFRSCSAAFNSGFFSRDM
jgi:hypothetical protein